jgi:hypothetical protein
VANAGAVNTTARPKATSNEMKFLIGVSPPVSVHYLAGSSQEIRLWPVVWR